MSDHIKTRDRVGRELNIAATERLNVQYPLNHLMNAAGRTINPATEDTASLLLTAAQAIKTAAAQKRLAAKEHVFGYRQGWQQRQFLKYG